MTERTKSKLPRPQWLAESQGSSQPSNKYEGSNRVLGWLWEQLPLGKPAPALGPGSGRQATAQQLQLKEGSPLLQYCHFRKLEGG